MPWSVREHREAEPMDVLAKLLMLKDRLETTFLPVVDAYRS